MFVRVLFVLLTVFPFNSFAELPEDASNLLKQYVVAQCGESTEAIFGTITVNGVQFPVEMAICPNQSILIICEKEVCEHRLMNEPLKGKEKETSPILEEEEGLKT